MRVRMGTSVMQGFALRVGRQVLQREPKQDSQHSEYTPFALLLALTVQYLEECGFAAPVWAHHCQLVTRSVVRKQGARQR